ncbi:MAG: biotin--[acetyl-CoA-carboxylase] ligase, partial [Cyanobacteria bacterium]|nr:biotin--[acetyl-CoA-carboxylase] ligase [Cyanobacteriota bacterium]
MIDLGEIERRLSTRLIGKPAGGANELWESIDSTNTRAAELAACGAPEGTIVLARQQTRGRGRMGREWISPVDSGLYFSLILRPEKRVADVPPITLGVGVAAAKAIFATVGVEVGLKWVNDLVYDGKKLGGILAEMPANLKPQAIIVGIGVNRMFDPETLPAELRERVTWLEEIADSPVDMNAVTAELCFQLEEVYGALMQDRIQQTLDEWRALSVTLGKTIKFTSGSREQTGIAIDITSSGALIVDCEEGGQLQLTGGEQDDAAAEPVGSEWAAED